MFGNDIEAMVIFGTLAHLNVAHLLAPGSRPSEKLAADGRVAQLQLKLRAVRLRDLAQVIGRPPETVRRKLEQLLAAGRVRRVDEGWVYSTDTVDPEIRAQGMDGARRLLQAADGIRAALQDARHAIQDDQFSEYNSFRFPYCDLTRDGAGVIARSLSAWRRLSARSAPRSLGETASPAFTLSRSADPSDARDRLRSAASRRAAPR